MDSVLQNIFEQPQVLEKLVTRHAEHLHAKRRLLQRRFDKIIISGMGTSYFSGYPAFLLLSEHAHAPVMHLDASELLHYQSKTITDDTLLILVSQSGESFEIVKILQSLNHHPIIIGLTMTEKDTTLKRAATIHLALADTEETSLGAFKSFTASILLLLILCQYICHQADALSVMQQEMTLVKSVMADDLPRWQKICAAVTSANSHAYHFIARGPCLCAAQAGALIAMEMAKVNTLMYSGGQFRHGPIETAAEPGNQYVVLAPSGKTQSLCLRLAQEIAALNSNVFLLTSDQSIAASDRVQILHMPEIAEYLSPILYSIPLQFYAYDLTLARGLAPGTARVISKVTTRQ